MPSRKSRVHCMAIPYFCKGINVDVAPASIGANMKKPPCLNLPGVAIDQNSQIGVCLVIESHTMLLYQANATCLACKMSLLSASPWVHSVRCHCMRNGKLVIAVHNVPQELVRLFWSICEVPRAVPRGEWGRQAHQVVYVARWGDDGSNKGGQTPGGKGGDLKQEGRALQPRACVDRFISGNWDGRRT